MMQAVSSSDKEEVGLKIPNLPWILMKAFTEEDRATVWPDLGLDPGEEQVVFEIGLVIPKRSEEAEGDSDAIKVMVDAFKNAGLVVDRVTGLVEEFIKLAAPSEALGKAAASLQIKKRTHIGIDLPFDWDQVEAFARQGDGSLFSWCERYRCYHYLLHGIVNESRSAIAVKYDGKEFCWEP